MTEWMRYPHFGRIMQLKDNGRELIGEMIFWTVKRDGSNITISYDDNHNVRISSHNIEYAQADLTALTLATKQYKKALAMLDDEPTHLFYYELIPIGSTPTRIEPSHKIPQLILLDIHDGQRWLSYNYCHQVAYHHKIPIVPLIDAMVYNSLNDLFDHRDEMMKWCKRHRREGVVGKAYYSNPQYFVKEKIDLPKLQKIEREPVDGRPELPPMPLDKLMNAIEQAEYDVTHNGGNFTQPKDAMPVVARYVSTQAREHFYSPPRDIFMYYKKYIEGRVLS